MPERTISSERVYAGRVVSLRLETVEYENGKLGQREIVEHAPVVVIAPLLDDDTLLLVRQHRAPVAESLLELPAGGIDGDETPQAAVHRELIEETGYRAGEIRALSTFYSAPGYCNELMHLYLARDLQVGDAEPEEDESIELEPVSLAEARRLIRSGEIRDSKSIAGIYCLLDYLAGN